jgi:hypothetical protein
MARDQVFSIEDDETADGLLVGILLLLESASVGTRLGRELCEGIAVGLEEGDSLGAKVPANVGTGILLLSESASVGTRLGRELLEGIVVGLEEGVSLGMNVG